jgi:hypothetical protein
MSWFFENINMRFKIAAVPADILKKLPHQEDDRNCLKIY